MGVIQCRCYLFFLDNDVEKNMQVIVLHCRMSYTYSIHTHISKNGDKEALII